MKTSISFYKILGIILSIFAIIGYLTLADDMRHTGEFIGVSSVLISGIIFMFVENKTPILKRFSLQWIAICILLSVPLGGVLFDDMILALCFGIVIGILLAIIFGKKGNKEIIK